MELILICTTLVISVLLISRANIVITVRKPNDVITTPAETIIAQSDLDKAYEDAGKDKAPDFLNVIAEINKEFGGVDYGE